MLLPTEPIGSIPRSPEFLAAFEKHRRGELSLDAFQEAATRALTATIERFERTGSPVLTDGEQTKPSFATYPIDGAANIAPGGVTIPFADGHSRQLPRLTAGPFRYATYADTYLRAAQKLTARPVKQAVIAASALSLLYPAEGIESYSREQFLDDLVNQAASDIRRSLDAGAHCVQIDFTEGRLSLKLDPSGALLNQFIDLNNRVLDRFSAADRPRLGVHSCPGGDRDSTHSADIAYAGLLPALFRLNVGNFYLQMASETEPEQSLRQVASLLQPNQRVFVGVIDPIDATLETPELVRDRILTAAQYIPVSQLGATDDCGFSPFIDDASTARDLAFAKITARVEGVGLALKQLQSLSATV